jgi:hypothetical protein
MLGSNNLMLLDPKHGKNVKVSITRWVEINALDSCSRESVEGLFIGAVMGFDNNIQTAPLTTSFTLNIQSVGIK